MKLRYQVIYFKFIRTTSGGLRNPDAYGCSDNLQNLLRNSAGRCAIENYNKAIIMDRKKGAVIYRLKRNAGSITIEKVQN